MSKINDDEILDLNKKVYNLSKNSFYIGIFLTVLALLVSLITANYAISVAKDALSHQKIIEESDLQIGYPQYGQDRGINPSIRFPVINGYYARYPTQIIGVSVILNGKKIDFLKWIPPLETDNTTYPKNYVLVERDTPTYLKFVFYNETEYNISEYDRPYTLKYVIPQEYRKLLKEENDMMAGIHYIDFNKMKEFTVLAHFTFGYLNKNITSLQIIEVGRDDGIPLQNRTVKVPDL